MNQIDKFNSGIYVIIIIREEEPICIIIGEDKTNNKDISKYIKQIVYFNHNF